LRLIKETVDTLPWLIIGDFNVICYSQEKWGKEGFSCYDREFVECVQQLEIDDLSFSGCFHTWTNNQVGEDFVSKKLDRVLSNGAWLHSFGRERERDF
jgi:hypothetical protein